MRKYFKTIPNRLTALRLGLLPILWVLALLGHSVWVGWGLLMAGLTDMLDGLIARKLKQVTTFGSQFDSVADSLLIVSSASWLLMFRPEIFEDHIILILVLASLGALNILVGVVKFRRFGNLHLYSTKAAGVVAFAFAVHALLSTHYSEWLFNGAMALIAVSIAETLALMLTRSKVDEHIGSIIFTAPSNLA